MTPFHSLPDALQSWETTQRDPNVFPTHSLEIPPGSMRALVACYACRSRRRKCEAQSNGSLICVYCSIRGISCRRKPMTSGPGHALQLREDVSRSSPSDFGSPLSGVVTALPPLGVVMELVELYFDLIHDQFHSLFHRPSFMEALSNGTAPRVLLFAMMAFSARFSTHEMFSGIPPRDRSQLYYDESAKLLDIRDTSLTTIQACVLLGGISTTEDNAVTESIYYTVACRMANLLHLPDMQTSSPLEREINIRVWWTLCMVDVWSSKSVRLPRQMVHLHDLDLPIDEATFLRLRPDSELPADLTSDRSFSLLAQMIKLNRILVEINDVMAEAAESRNASNLIITHKVEDLSNKLHYWKSSLPDQLLDTPENLQRYAREGLGRLFVAVYLGYYHFGQILLYQFLHEDRESTGQNVRADMCKEFAARLCDLVYRAQATPGCEVWYNMVGHILVIASTIQIHTLLFSPNPSSLSSARSRLECNFKILLQLKTYWPMLKSCFARLQIFHEVCRKNGDDTQSFRMDMWMLKFLSEFNEPVREKEIDGDDGRDIEEGVGRGLCDVENVGVSPQDWV